MSDLPKPEMFTAFVPEQMPRLQDVLGAFRRKLEEGNFLEYWEVVDVTTPTSANTEFTVTCTTLNRIPSYYFVVKKNKAVDVYDSGTTAIKNKLYLKATVSSATITILVR